METTKCDQIENTRCRICMLVFLVSFVLGKIALLVVVYPNIAFRIYIIGWVVFAWKGNLVWETRVATCNALV